MPIDRSVLSRNVCPAPAASAAWPSLSTSVHFAGFAAVVESRLADQLDLDRALEALDGAHQHVLGVIVGRWPGVRRHQIRPLPRAHGQRVVDEQPATRRVPGRRHHVRARHIGTRGGHVDAVRAEPEGPCPAVQEVRRTRSASRKRARHSQSTEPSGATSAPVWQFDRKA